MKYYAFIYRALIIMSIGSLMLQGCKKGENKDDEGMSAEFEMLGYTVQDGFDTEGNPRKRATFQLSGTKDLNISFFSGDIGGNYESRDGRVQKLTDLDVSFSSNCSFGTQGCGMDVFSIMASTNYNGGHQPEDVQAANWVNITDRFTISPFESGTSVYYESRIANIADVTERDKPLYLAMRHVTHNQVVDGVLSNVYTAFRVRDWKVSGHIEGEEDEELADQTIADFTLVEIGNFRPGRNALSTSLVTLRGNHGNVASNLEHLEAETEGWVISKPITIGDIHFDADLPLRVKMSHQPPVETFSFNYSGPGEYNAVFVLSTGDGTGESVTKAVTINIP